MGTLKAFNVESDGSIQHIFKNKYFPGLETAPEGQGFAYAPPIPSSAPEFQALGQGASIEEVLKKLAKETVHMYVAKSDEDNKYMAQWVKNVVMDNTLRYNYSTSSDLEYLSIDAVSETLNIPLKQLPNNQIAIDETDNSFALLDLSFKQIIALAARLEESNLDKRASIQIQKGLKITNTHSVMKILNLETDNTPPKIWEIN